MYHNFDVAKKGNKARQINAPNQRFKFFQHLIAGKLDTLYRRRNSVHGYIVGRSVKTNASSHLTQRFVLNLDVKDFFISISGARVEGVLTAIGVSARVAAIVARICCYQGRLPQGGPSSPILSNMICFRLDRELLKIAKETKCIYTHYADDITISSRRPLFPLFQTAPPQSGPVALKLLAGGLRAVFSSNGFALNPTKAHYADRHSRRIVTGLKVNEGLNVDRCFVRNIRATLFAVEHDRVTAQAHYSSDFGGSSTISAHIKVKTAWIGSVKGLAEPVYRSLALRFNKSFLSEFIKVQPAREEKIDRSV